MAAKLKIRAQIAPDGAVFTVTGQEARTLSLLIENGKLGVGAYDFRGGPPFRLGAYVHDLRHEFGLSIETLRDEHVGGWHARYRLETPVRIVHRSDELGAAA